MNNIMPKLGDTIAVWFSCGAASAIAAAETVRHAADSKQSGRRAGAMMACPGTGQDVQGYGCAADHEVRR